MTTLMLRLLNKEVMQMMTILMLMMLRNKVMTWTMTMRMQKFMQTVQSNVEKLIDYPKPSVFYKAVQVQTQVQVANKTGT